ncbi:zinc finger MYM-type protein 1-like [Wyeomyia smithii]|uniref:zinc finger MYM-type protein 1-like n=1 Tax=Wyeomyia smithii TaxID=174621 RepID=UPI002467C6CB|nr:zinc finger MYM-type protein 1-like [Wyeomyia smithii]XP_055524478.1 zinc finger MYM-type protein 1-like [Wyeomyia smithii]XP_055524479.1 zinc finger MYM-type protein 1-like [Wyeomyia smithii]XP_055524480.1 zinc finger MYM-type protein 1-like [Wyeomyia smithii]XP_055524482.1 zinc finger MYM-type protein 1-like [Wyeomyia smithii]XP_055524483.1 zinc finger MYM-type protein 1-like [Wyeomyia smithii]
MNFPTDASNRRFTTKNILRKLCNGEEIKRKWLIYSVCKDKIYCFCCRLFSRENILISSSSGYSDWKNLSVYLSRHEKSPSHIKAAQSWRELSHRLSSNKSIDEENQRLIIAETEHWNEVLKRLLCIVEFLASQGLSFRGKSEGLFEHNNGNLLKLVEYIAKFDIVLAEHLRRITSAEIHAHYLSKTTQNEFISLLSDEIKQNILSAMKYATYYSIILDCTPDTSHTEQMTMIVRFVKAIPGQKVSIQEHFICFIPIDDSSGEGLQTSLLEELVKNNIELKNMRGQGYDNGSNMRGKNLGVQKRILELNPRAFFVPCSNHSLNLVNDGAKSCFEAVDFFSVVQEIFNFFSASTHRWSVLKKHITSLTVKPLSGTRWESRIDAVTPLRFNIGEIYDALYEASEDLKQDAFARNTAKSLAKKKK